MMAGVRAVRLLLTVLAVTLAVSAHSKTVLIVGDSLSDSYDMPRESGWVYRLSERLGEDYTVVNASISGETTAGAAARIDGLIDSHRPDVLVVILGGNDGLRALSPSQIEQNLDKIINRGLDAGAQVALMQIRMPANLGPAYVERFEAVYPRLADDYELTLLPFFLESLYDQPGMMGPDGIHPTEQAQPKMLEAVWPHLQSLLEPG